MLMRILNLLIFRAREEVKMAIIIPTSHLVVFLAPVDRRCRNTPVPVGRSRLRRRRHLGALAMSDIFPPLLSHFFSLPSSIRLDGRGRERGGSGGGEMLKFSGLAVCPCACTLVLSVFEEEVI